MQNQKTIKTHRKGWGLNCDLQSLEKQASLEGREDGNKVNVIPVVGETGKNNGRVHHKISGARTIAYFINPLIYIVFSFLYFLYYLWLF